MPKPKGPEKVFVGFRVTRAALEWLERKANGRPVPTYLAERIEREAAVATKNVQPRFKKGGK
jgi:hypothetical protein